MIINFMEELNEKIMTSKIAIWISSKLKKITKDSRSKPTIKFELLDNNVYFEQLDNAKKYEEKSKLGKYGFYGFGLLGSIILFPIVIGYDMPEWLLIPMVISMLFAIFTTLIWARCPHCNSLQPGYQYSFSIFNGISASYGKGISPFAKRCIECEYYLSQRVLKKDLQKQKEEMMTQDNKVEDELNNIIKKEKQ